MASKPSPTRPGLVALSLFILLLAPASETDAQHADPGTVVHFDLERGRVLDPLPFDVPFFLLTPAPDGLQYDTVRAALHPTRDGAGCPSPDLQSDSPATVCGRFPRPGATCALDAKRVMAKPQGETEPEAHIEISLPALEVRQDYCLGIYLVREPTESEERRMLRAARSATQGISEALLDSSETIDDYKIDSARTNQACAEITHAMGDALGEDLRLVFNREESLTCGLIKKSFEQMASSTAQQTFREQLDDVVDHLGSIQRNLSDDTSAFALRSQTLSTKADLQKYLLDKQLPKTEVPLTPEWARAARDRVHKLRRDFQDEDADCLKANPTSEDLLSCFADEDLSRLETELEDLELELQREWTELAEEIVALFKIGATTWEGFKGRFNWYFTADEGVAYGWDVEETFTYTGVNIYTRPVNKAASLDQFKFNESLRRRFAFVVGLSNTTVSESDVPGIDPIVLDRFVLVGAGLRLTDHIRLSGGALLFDELDPDPLIDEDIGLTLSPFFSLSLDVDVVSIFTGFFGSGSQPGDE